MNRISSRQPKIISNAIILDDQSQRDIRNAHPGKHSKYSGHHVTLDFGKNEYHEDFGKQVQITVTGYANDDKAEAVLVSCGGTRCNNPSPHITISTEPGVKPVYSNELLAKGHEPVKQPLTLYGTVGSFVDGKYITEKI
jgi:hypothetical protein